jgi:hypothetical protein
VFGRSANDSISAVPKAKKRKVLFSENRKSYKYKKVAKNYTDIHRFEMDLAKA